MGLPVENRQEAYLGIILAIASDPTMVDQPWYDLIGRAYATDQEAFRTWEEANKGTEVERVFSVQSVSAFLDSTGDTTAKELFLDAVMDEQAVRNEPLFDAALMAAASGFTSVVAQSATAGTGVAVQGFGAGVKYGVTRPLAIAGNILSTPAGNLVWTGTKLTITASAMISSAGYLAAYGISQGDPMSILRDAADEAEQIQQAANAQASYLNGVSGIGTPFVAPTYEPGSITAATQFTAYDPTNPIPPGLTADEQLAALNQSNPFVGIEYPGYTARVQGASGAVPESNQADPDPVEYRVGPRYRMTDVEQTLGNMTPGQLLDFQERAIAAGLIDPESTARGGRFSLGTPDNHTLSAMNTVMGNANRMGQNWGATLRDMVERAAEQPKPSESRGPFVRRSYPTPDYATLSQVAKAAVSQRLGREINDWEMALLADQQKTLHRQEFDTQEATRLAEWRAQGRAMDAERRIATPKPTQQVDASARFSQFFDEKFANELDRAEDTDRVARKSGALFAGLDNASRLIGG